MKDNPYDKLDVPKNKDIEYYREEYRSLVKEHHPDMGGSRENFIEIKHAYERIKSDIKSDDENRNIVERITEEDYKKDNKKNDRKNKYKNQKYKYPCNVRYVNYDIINLNDELTPIKIFKNWDKYEYKYEDIGQFTVKNGNSILDGSEHNGNNWPYSCRGGACSNCAIKVINGSVETAEHHILSKRLLDKGYRLSCIGKPLSEDIDIVYNINQHEDIQEYLLPSR